MWKKVLFRFTKNIITAMAYNGISRYEENNRENFTINHQLSKETSLINQLINEIEKIKKEIEIIKTINYSICILNIIIMVMIITILIRR